MPLSFPQSVCCHRSHGLLSSSRGRSYQGILIHYMFHGKSAKQSVQISGKYMVLLQKKLTGMPLMSLVKNGITSIQCFHRI